MRPRRTLSSAPGLGAISSAQARADSPPATLALDHYEVGLVLAAADLPLRAADGHLTAFGLVVRHYAHQLPHRERSLDLLALSIHPHALQLVIRIRRDPRQPAVPDPARLREGIRWLKAMTTGARQRGALRGRWQAGRAGAGTDRLWARGFARRLLRSSTEIARAISACRRSSA